MSELLLLAGVALCVLSLIVAAVQLAQTRPPRAAAILFVLGVAALLGGAMLDPRPFQVSAVGEAWRHLLSGNIVR